MGYVIGPVRLALPAVCTDIANIRWQLKLLAGAISKSTAYGLAIHLSASATPSGTAFLPAYAGAFAARSIVTALPQSFPRFRIGFCVHRFRLQSLLVPIMSFDS